MSGLKENLLSEKSNARAKGNEVHEVDQSIAPSWKRVIFVSMVMGFIFGAMFAKSRVFVPENIRGQFLFKRWVMLKMFLGAMGGSALSISLASFLNPVAFQSAREAWSSVSGQSFSTLILGSLLLGVGMAISGACPGMVLAQIGAGVPNSTHTALGGLAGALTYGLLHPAINFQNPAFENTYLDHFLQTDFAKISTTIGITCIFVSIIFEFIINFTDETNVKAAWPPSFCGIIIGLLQLPALISIGTFLGSATAYQVVSSLCMFWILPFNSLKQFWSYFTFFLKPRFTTHWQIFYIGFAIIGAYWVEKMMHDNFGNENGVGKMDALIGGFVMVFGARMAGGCTSGHGISGCPILMIYSFIAVAFMFIGGIATAFAMNSWDDKFFAPSDFQESCAAPIMNY